jgi:4-hydroxy-2-oxoheptanedioate aldolase
MAARIFNPARNQMQSGRGKTKSWVLEFEPQTSRQADPLMGWTSSAETLQQVRLQFETAEQAKAIVTAALYPPCGKRGLGGARAARWGGYPAYVGEANAQICIIAQIETEKAIDNIEKIAAVDGIDALFLGPADLAASEGLLGPVNFDALFKLTGEALARIVATGKPAGILSRDERLVQQYLTGGARFIANGIDSFAIAKASGENARFWRERISAQAGG